MGQSDFYFESANTRKSLAADIKMKIWLIYFSATILLISGHEVHTGKCPDLAPMNNFNWEKFSDGIWYVTEKFDTNSRCLTYEFKTNSLGYKSIEQINQIPYTNKLGIDNHYIYTGKLYTPQESMPSKMVVKFPLNLIGSASFTVLDTDYENYGMICTCQDMNLLVTYAHRRSCSILHRTSNGDHSSTSAKMKNLLNSQVEDGSHDFDRIPHSGCDYNTNTGLNIDVDKVIGNDDDDLVADEDYDTYYGDYVPDNDAEIFDISQYQMEEFRQNLRDRSKTKPDPYYDN